ncbi:MAG: PHP domain-containing protein, partial [Pseudomonadales bacterium]|nr:PHP domain-containing protein [Pseudomonadales bacterium]
MIATENQNFVHLRVHSEYSLTNSIVKVKKLVKQCAELNQPAVALTDQCNFFALVKFYKAALAEGVKPIIGSDFLLQVDDHDYVITLFAMNNQGYKNLTELISKAYLEGQTFGGDARIQWQWLEAHSEGVLALSGAKRGEIGQALLKSNQSEAEALLLKYQQLFQDRFYLELQRTQRSQDEQYLQAAVALAAQHHVPVVATNDVHFHQQAHFAAHESRVCIGDQVVLDDNSRERKYSEQQYLKSSEEMQQLFADIPTALQNSVEIAKRCNVQLHLGEYFLPEYPIPANFEQDAFFQRIPYAQYESQTKAV